MSDENGNESRFKLGGKTFVALEWSPCLGCAFADFPGKCSNYARPPCDPESRKDGKTVVFVVERKALKSKPTKRR